MTFLERVTPLGTISGITVVEVIDVETLQVLITDCSL
jgi:hypothetical protein